MKKKKKIIQKVSDLDSRRNDHYYFCSYIL